MRLQKDEDKNGNQGRAAGSTRHLRAIESRRNVEPDPSSFQRAARKRNFFHRTSARSTDIRTVVSDVAASRVVAMVRRSTARLNQVRDQGWLLVCHQEFETPLASRDTLQP